MLKTYSSFAAILVTALSVSSPASAAPMFNPSSGHWYDVVSSGANGSWDNAEANAVSLGGHLVTLNDAVEEAWVRGAFGLSTWYWIGYNDAVIEGAFVWSSGETPGYTNWVEGEPNNAMPTTAGEDYAMLNHNPITGAWNDWSHLRPDYLNINISGIAEYITAGPTFAVPEPATIFIFALGLAGLGVMRRRNVVEIAQAMTTSCTVLVQAGR